jgi:hypothetical protein
VPKGALRHRTLLFLASPEYALMASEEVVAFAGGELEDDQRCLGGILPSRRSI